VPDFDLKVYLALFPTVCKRKFNRSYNLAKLEKELEQVRTGGRQLTARDVMKIFDPERTPYARYWPKPNEKELNRALTREPLRLAPIRGDGRELIERLLGVFHNLGHVSLVLRFVHPDRFGIFSTPIVNLVQIHRPRTVDLYLAFCQELAEWQEHFDLASVAETETALWTYHELAVVLEQTDESEQARLDFENDLWVQRQRVAQSVTPFLTGHGPLELARILAEEHVRLAAMIAGVEFERLLRLRARKLHGGRKHPPKKPVDILIDELAREAVITWPEARDLHKVWDVRNKAVHPDLHLSREEVEWMIEVIEAICSAWE
jgi:hypothetical protein